MSVVVGALAVIGGMTVTCGLVLLIVALWQGNRSTHINWHTLYAQAHGVGFGFWRVWVVRDVGDQRSVVLPSRWLVSRYVNRFAGNASDIMERGRSRGRL